MASVVESVSQFEGGGKQGLPAEEPPARRTSVMESVSQFEGGGSGGQEAARRSSVQDRIAALQQSNATKPPDEHSARRGSVQKRIERLNSASEPKKAPLEKAGSVKKLTEKFEVPKEPPPPEPNATGAQASVRDLLKGYQK